MRAYYAAESGIESALLKIRRGEALDTTGACVPQNLDAASKLAITCLRVTKNNNNFEGGLTQDTTTQIDLSSLAGVNNLVFSWSVDGYDSSTIPNTSAGFPKSTVSPWPATAPPVVEVGLVEFPSDATFRIGDVKYYQGILRPSSGTSGDPSFGMPGVFAYSYTDGPANSLHTAKCLSGNAPYHCAIGISGLQGTKKYLVRLRSRYGAGKFKLTVKDAAGTVLNVPTSTYTIDVTAQAGDSLRRVVTSLSDAAAANGPAAGLDYVLYSDTNICKDFEIKGPNITPHFCPLP